MGGFERVRLAMAAVTIAVMASLLSLRSDAAQEVRVALVIANSDYANAPDLTNPVRDAAAVAEALGRAGFTMIERPAPNLSHAAMLAAINGFAAKARNADVAVVYYAGHGVEIEGRNYLVPVDARFDKAEDVDDFTAVPLDLVLKSVDRARRLKLVILDACRNNPFASKWALAPGGGKTRSFGGRGLAPVPVEGDTLVAFAAEAGTEASDGPDEGNSPFVRALTRNLPAPGVDVRIMFGKVRDEVVSETGGKQRPFLYGSMGGQEFFFVPKGAKVATGPDPAKGKKPGESFRDCPDCPEMVIVPAGSFTMGSPPDEPGRDKDEGPQRKVTIAQAFAVGRFEVTRGQYAAFVQATGRETGSSCAVFSGSEYKFEGNRNWRSPGFEQTDAHPLVCVSWEEAQAYVQWLSQQTGRRYRLLSEAEWEYAAREGTTSAFIWGTDPNAGCRDANGADRTAQGKLPSNWTYSTCTDGAVFTAPVGSYAANRFGLKDMIGNAWEWTEDCYNESYAGGPADGTAWRTGDCSRRVLRGGSWIFNPQILRSASRSWLYSSGRSDYVGFRLARTL